MLGKKIYKPIEDYTDYTNIAEWCNNNGCMIVDMGDYYEVEENPIYVPTEEEIRKQLTDGVQSYMDSVAQTRGYDDILKAISYRGDTVNTTFAQEGEACFTWRSQVWTKYYAILAEVKAGNRAIPTLEEVIAELPVLVW